MSGGYFRTSKCQSLNYSTHEQNITYFPYPQWDMYTLCQSRSKMTGQPPVAGMERRVERVRSNHFSGYPLSAAFSLTVQHDAMSFPLTATKGTSRYVHIPLVSPAIGPRSCSMHEIRGKFLYKCGNLKRNLKFKLKLEI